MDAKRASEKVAEEVNDISLDYHLSHATFACDKLVQQRYREYAEAKLKIIGEELKIALKKNDNETISKLLKEKIVLESKEKFHIFVEYVPNMDEGSGRAIKTNNQLVINLPQKLLDKTKNSDPNQLYNGEAVKTLREMMAHELGHIALHIKELMEIDSLNGSKALRNEKAEEEAEWFAKKLLDLRKKRNDIIYKNGTYKHF